MRKIALITGITGQDGSYLAEFLYIIPHSVFSWWGAWLNRNPNKIVIAPETWFNPQYLEIEINTLDLIPDTWIKIKNYKGKSKKWNI